MMLLDSNNDGDKMMLRDGISEGSRMMMLDGKMKEIG